MRALFVTLCFFAATAHANEQLCEYGTSAKVTACSMGAVLLLVNDDYQKLVANTPLPKELQTLTKGQQIREACSKEGTAKALNLRTPSGRTLAEVAGIEGKLRNDIFYKDQSAVGWTPSPTYYAICEVRFPGFLRDPKWSCDLLCDLGTNIVYK